MTSVTTEELCGSLGVTRQEIKRWRDAGLPHRRVGRGYDYDLDRVEQWLLSNGKIVEEGSATVLTSVRAVADRYNVSARTVRDWHNEPKFPGRTGWYPIEAMDLWVELRPQIVNPPKAVEPTEQDQARSELFDRQIREKDLKIAKLQGELMPIRLAVETISQVVAQASAVFDEFPPLVLSEFPDADPDIRSRILATATRIVEDCKRSLRTLPNQLEHGARVKPN